MKVIKLFNKGIGYKHFLFEKDNELYIFRMNYGVENLKEAEERFISYQSNKKFGGNGDSYIPVYELRRYYWLRFDDRHECYEYEKHFKRELKLKRILNEIL